MRSLTTASVFMLVLLSAVTSFSQDGPPRGGPPQEAIDACSGAAEGDTCSFELEQGDVNGTCRTPPRHEQLLCVPEGDPPRRGEPR